MMENNRELIVIAIKLITVTDLVHTISSNDHDNGHGFVDQRQRAMFQLTGHNTLTVQIRQLLDFLSMKFDAHVVKNRKHVQ